MDFYLVITNKVPDAPTLGLTLTVRVVPWDLILNGSITTLMLHVIKYCLKGQLHWGKMK